MIRKRRPLSAIIIVFCIHNTTEGFKNLTYECEHTPFAKNKRLCILTIAKKDDPTIKLLYEIAKRVFQDEATEEDARQDAIITVCNKAKSQFNKATSLLEEDVSDPRARKPTMNCFTDRLQLMDSLRIKYTPTPASPSTTTTTEQSAPLPRSDDGQFVDDYRKEQLQKGTWPRHELE
ncbi:predicted protein [Lichtheimia corymbifera JMRC:FSU:9682]|uniref:Uncharacterized protein n=1 Tax=Lichtheimia corymbifera JMRC:FSU:9682 TaxID=1263082 RepID=A0A068RID5_9FUNG|nr:predicted protein [Lichtheimia corymbifera JMRC:FSU:9682]